MSAPAPPKLQTLNLTLTTRCNLSCPCCYQRNSPDDLPFDRIAELRDQAVALGLERVMLSGGEPLMREDLEEIVALFASSGVDVTLSTNGSLVDAQRAAALRQAGVRTISLSVAGVDDVDKLDRSAGSAETEDRAASILLEAGLRVVANIIVTRSNLPHFDRSLKRVHALGIENLNLLRPKPSLTPGWFERVRLGASELHQLQRLKMKLAGDSRFEDVTVDCALCPLLYGAPPSWLDENGVTGCTAGSDFLNITAQGAVYPCPDLRQPALLVGNIHSDDLVELWRESEILIALRDPTRLEGACGRCKLVKQCRGCRSLALHDQDNVFGDDLDCPYRGRSLLGRAAKLAPVYANLALAARRTRD